VNRPTTAREALIAEALGDVAQLVDRVEALGPAMDEARRALDRASAGLSRQAEAFERRVTALAENAQSQAVRHIARQTDALTRQSMDTQTRAMAEAARALFAAEIRPALQHLSLPLRQTVARLDRPWLTWLSHSATAVVASVITGAVILFFGAS
jgi:ABC-type transporter Mla subunit MlaD